MGRSSESMRSYYQTNLGLDYRLNKVLIRTFQGHLKFDDTVVKLSDEDLPTPPANASLKDSSADYIEDLEMLKYMNEYNAKWPTSFWLQFRVLFIR